jgi:hypothetical protein
MRGIILTLMGVTTVSLTLAHDIIQSLYILYLLPFTGHKDADKQLHYETMERYLYNSVISCMGFCLLISAGLLSGTIYKAR